MRAGQRDVWRRRRMRDVANDDKRHIGMARLNGGFAADLDWGSVFTQPAHVRRERDIGNAGFRVLLYRLKQRLRRVYRHLEGVHDIIDPASYDEAVRLPHGEASGVQISHDEFNSADFLERDPGFAV